jgi:glycosyltransferase involved in cell wall biosynthesis
MKIIIAAPYPPPITGNSLPIIVLYDYLKDNNQIEKIDLNNNGYINGKFTFKRAFDVIKILVAFVRKKDKQDIIYLTIAQSFVGNLRDLFIYLICFNKLDHMIIHMLGGAEMKNILTPSSKLQFKINKFFINRLAAVVVEGQTQADFFANVIDKDKIYINPNFAEDFLFTNEAQIYENFSKLEPIRVIFLSNHLYGKGYEELAEGYMALPKEMQEQIKIDFVGSFSSGYEKDNFLKKIKLFDKIKYHGSLYGQAKKDIFTQAHVFCMPTYYPYEGQPFSILEAYATGCMVVTTNHSGIGQVFKDNKNGFEVDKKSVIAVTKMLERLILEKQSLKKYALYNLEEAKGKYNTSVYLEKMKYIFEKIQQ